VVVRYVIQQPQQGNPTLGSAAYAGTCAAAYRFGFNGKEKDDEVHGATGTSMDFGDRMLDTRVGRWMSIDKLFHLTPDLSPYNYVANNPLRFTDPSGNFLLDVHQRIVQNALNKFGLKLPFAGEKNANDSKNLSFQFGIVGQGTIFSGGITDPDWNSADDHSAHFDQMNFTCIITNTLRIDQATRDIAGKYKNGDVNEKTFGYEVGKHLHAIQDLYSHSNYIELYTAMYGEQANMENIPTLNEALTDEKYSLFATVLMRDLKTGNYPGTGEGSHKEMNHDVGAGSNYGGIVPETRGKKVTYASRAAEAVATKASVEYLEQVKGEVEK
jgi:RHS repeat-associated protein